MKPDKLIALLSPSKTLDESPMKAMEYHEQSSLPKFLAQSHELIALLKKYSVAEIEEIMKVSHKIAELNYQRYHNFEQAFAENGDLLKQAIFLFKGDVYNKFDVQSMSGDEVLRANEKIKILSGLYGILNPLDKIFPYRFEMGINLENKKSSSLYGFWGNTITQEINAANATIIINLASVEYSKVIDNAQLSAQIIDVVFLENRRGQYRNIGIFAKKARGAMARYIVQNDITSLKDLKEFNLEGYEYSSVLSRGNNLTFVNHKEII